MKNKFLYSILFVCMISIVNVAVYAGDKNKNKDKSPVVTLSSSNYADETSKGLVLVDFWAAWCRPCRRIAPILGELAGEYKGSVVIGKLNVDNYKKFAIGQKVQALPTIIVYKDGKEMERIVGLVKKADLVKVIEKYRDKN